LAQLVTAGFEAFRGGDSLASTGVESAKIAQQRGGVSTACTQFLFNKFQAGTDKCQIEHCSSSLLD